MSKKLMKYILVGLLLVGCGKSGVVVQHVEVDRTTLSEIETVCNEIYTRSSQVDQCIGKFVTNGTVE